MSDIEPDDHPSVPTDLVELHLAAEDAGLDASDPESYRGWADPPEEQR